MEKEMIEHVRKVCDVYGFAPEEILDMPIRTFFALLKHADSEHGD